MKSKILLFTFAATTLFLSGIPAFAQSGETQLYAVLENSIIPGQISVFEESLQKLNALKKQNQMTSWGGPVIGLMDSPTYYHIFTPMTGFGDLDDMQKELTRKTDKKWNEVLDDLLKTKEYEKWWIVLERQDLSYHPEGARANIQGDGYVSMVFFYGFSGKKSDTVDLFRDWVKLYKENNITHGFTVFETVMGGERPLYLIVEVADDVVSYHKRDRETVLKLGDAGDRLIQRSLPLCRKYEVKSGAFRPDLAYWNGF